MGGSSSSERQPLLDEPINPIISARLKSHAARAKMKTHVKHGKATLSSSVVTYDPAVLATWKVFGLVKGTCFTNPRILYMNASLILFAMMVAISVFCIVPDIQTMNPDSFYKIVYYFKVFIAFMLGLFLSNCVSRWWKTVVALTDFFLIIRKFAWLCNANDIPKHRRDSIQRLSLLSCCLLENEVTGFWYIGAKDQSVPEEKWRRMVEYCTSVGFAFPEEMTALESVHMQDRSAVVWTWIGVHIGECDKLSGPIKSVFTNLGNEAIACIKKMKTFVTMQLPFMYSHMLALLVHLNNVMLAFASGLSIAVLVGDCSVGLGYGGFPRNMALVYRGIQSIIVALLGLMVQPMLYQAFLEIAATLCDPFTDPVYGLPLLDYVEELRIQLREFNELAGHDAAWLAAAECPDAPAEDGSLRFAAAVEEMKSARAAARA